MVKYKLKKGNILKDGHTMFLQDVVQDLKRKAYLEDLKEKEADSSVSFNEVLGGLLIELEAEIQKWDDKAKEHAKKGNYLDIAGVAGVMIGLETAIELIKKKAA